MAYESWIKTRSARSAATRDLACRDKQDVSGVFRRIKKGHTRVHVRCSARRMRQSGRPLEEGEEVGGEVSKDSSGNLSGDG